MSPLDRLLAEAAPDGSFGGARTARPCPQPARPVWTPEQQAAHRAGLEAALDGWTYKPEPARPVRRLRVVPDAA